MLNPYSRVSRKLLRGWFDGAEEFLLYCKQSFNIDKLLNNIKFDRDQENRYYEKIESRYNLLTKLIAYDFSKIAFDQDLILYGAEKLEDIFMNR